MKQISFDLHKVLEGLNQTADVVKSTLGPKGRNVGIDDPMEPKITNDGVTIANSITYEDPEKNFGAYLVKNTSGETNDSAGDGTTTTALLLQEVIRESLKRPENPMEIRASLREAAHYVTREIKKTATQIRTDEQIKQIATISSENEEHGQMILEIIQKVGKKGTITLEDSRTFFTDYEITQGYKAHTGFISPHFITNVKEASAEYEDVPVAVFEHKIDTLADVKYLGEVLKNWDGPNKGAKSFVLVCHDISDSVLGNFIFWKQSGLLSALVIRAANTDLLDDIAAACGSTVIATRTGVSFDKIEKKHFGIAKKVISKQKESIFISDSPKAKMWSRHLEEMAGNNKNSYENSKLLERAAKLKGEIAVIRVGAPTDMEKWYLKHKLEDAVNATQSALEEGIVEGGGMALYRIAQRMPGKTVGEQILKKVLTAPLRTIIENAGKDYTDIILKMLPTEGYNAKKDEYGNLIKEGIIDPAKVERCAVENAVSTAGTFITMSAIITDEKREVGKGPQGN